MGYQESERRDVAVATPSTVHTQAVGLKPSPGSLSHGRSPGPEPVWRLLDKPIYNISHRVECVDQKTQFPGTTPRWRAVAPMFQQDGWDICGGPGFGEVSYPGQATLLLCHSAVRLVFTVYWFFKLQYHIDPPFRCGPRSLCPVSAFLCTAGSFSVLALSIWLLMRGILSIMSCYLWYVSILLCLLAYTLHPLLFPCAAPSRGKAVPVALLFSSGPHGREEVWHCLHLNVKK